MADGRDGGATCVYRAVLASSQGENRGGGRVLSALDFTPALPCEDSQHANRHANEPAAYLIKMRCPRCGYTAEYLICRSGLEIMRWYPVPSDATLLRYWDGTAWTNHVTPRISVAVAPADWYPDLSDATQLRYWDGTAWTNHVTPRSRASAAPAPVAPTIHAPATRPLEEPRISMSSAEWQGLVLAWMKAGAIGEELWRLISNARIEDADHATLESQREMEKLTAQQGADRIRLMLEADPSIRDEGTLTEFTKFFGGGRIADRQYVPLRNEKIKDAVRLT